MTSTNKNGSPYGLLEVTIRDLEQAAETYPHSGWILSALRDARLLRVSLAAGEPYVIPTPPPTPLEVLRSNLDHMRYKWILSRDELDRVADSLDALTSLEEAAPR